MKWSFKAALLVSAVQPLTWASPIVKRAYAAVGACDGTCSGDLHDPSVIYRADTQTYYRFTTNNKISIATAPNIAGPWTYQGSALPSGSSINLPGNQDLWAPDVFDFGGTYYMYYSVSASGSQNSDIGVATSTTLDAGSWQDHGSVGIPNNSAYNKIDPNLFQHDSASPPILSFGSFWDQIYQVQLASPPLSLATGAVPAHLEQDTTPRPDGLVNGATEGSYQFQWNGFYYLLFSSGNCCNEPPNLVAAGQEYHIMVCRSTSPTGPFVDQGGRSCLSGGGTLVLASHDDVYAPGGQGVFNDPQQGGPVMYYHYVRPSVGYGYDQFFFGWNRLDLSSGWPVVI